MAGSKDKLLNILLFPAKLFPRVTDNKVTLCIGTILIGIIYLFTPDILFIYKLLFTNMPAGGIRLNILIAAAVAVLIGVVYVVFFSVPLFDFFKYLKKKEDKPHNASLVKVMKFFIITQGLILLVNTAMFYVFFRGINENSSSIIIYIYLVYYFLLLLWSSGIISRGMNTLFDFNPLFRRLTLIVVFTWNFILVTIFDFQIMNWLIKLFQHA